MRPRAPWLQASTRLTIAPRVTVAGVLDDRPSGSEGYAVAPGRQDRAPPIRTLQARFSRRPVASISQIAPRRTF